MGNLPWHVKAVAQVGAPILASAWLLWFTTVRVSETLEAVSHSLAAHAQESAMWATKLEIEAGYQKAERAEIVKLLEVICFAVADNAPNDRRRRDECWRRAVSEDKPR